VVVTPSAPRRLTAQPGRKRVALRWAAPATNGGASITRYGIRATGPEFAHVVTLGGGARHYTVRGLQAGKRYAVRVRAGNAAGWGPWSPVVRVRPR
jgi:titin